MYNVVPANRSSSPEPYGDLVDLYAQRAILAKTILIADPKPIAVLPIGRGAASESVRGQLRKQPVPSKRLRSMATSLATSFGF